MSRWDLVRDLDLVVENQNKINRKISIYDVCINVKGIQRSNLEKAE